MKRLICLVLYYGFARYLPHTVSKFGGKTSNKLVIKWNEYI